MDELRHLCLRLKLDQGMIKYGLRTTLTRPAKFDITAKTVWRGDIAIGVYRIATDGSVFVHDYQIQKIQHFQWEPTVRSWLERVSSEYT